MKAEESLSELLYKNAHHPILVLKENFNIGKANPYFLRFKGLKEESFQDHNFTFYFQEESKTLLINHLNKAKTNHSLVEFECPLVSKDGDARWFNWQFYYHDASCEFFVSGSDITEFKTKESISREHTEKLLKIIELVPHPIFLKDANAKYILVNQAQANLFRLPKSTFIGKDDSYFIKVEDELKGVRASDNVVLEKNKNILLPEQTITDSNGNSIVLLTSKIPFQSSVNGEVNILGVSIDITSLKKSEQELRKINFELDTFVYHASHDLKAPLCSLEGLLKLIQTETDENLINKCAEEGLKSIRKLNTSISDLTNLSRNNRLEVKPSPIKFKKIIQDALLDLDYLQYSSRTAFSIAVNKKGDFYNDKNRMKIIFRNLLSNALQYQQENAEAPEVAISVTTDEHWAVIEIRDNGIGIEEKYKQKIFELFFRGSELSTGSGLGLYIVKEIVQKLNGSISLNSEETKGTCFTIKIPNLLRYNPYLSQEKSEWE